tara:strand:- start:1588 stop:3513 length:1926 start_codon:yes stop_codon:yes gene_type:complete
MGKIHRELHEEKRKRSAYHVHSTNLDTNAKGKIGKRYWSDEAEMFARAFESHAEDKLHGQGRRSDYLVVGTREPLGHHRHGKPAEPYPQGEERKAISKAFDSFFAAVAKTSTLRKALATRRLWLALGGGRRKTIILLRKAQVGLFGGGGGGTQQVQIRAHQARTKTGKVASVRAHTQKRKRATAAQVTSKMKQDKPKQRLLLGGGGVKKEGDPRPTVLGLFSGAGGLDYGLHRAGFRGVASVEMNPNACKTLRRMKDAGALEGSVVEADANTVDFSQWKGADLVAGGPPCQPFSSAGKKLGAEDLRDGWPIFLRAVEEVGPKHVLAENVKNMLSGDFKEYRKAITDRLDELGYESKWSLVNAADYGVPQLRERVFLTAWKKGAEPFHAPQPSHHDPRKGANHDERPLHRTALDVSDNEGHEYWDHREFQNPAPTARRPEWLKGHRPIKVAVHGTRDDGDEHRPTKAGEVPLTVTARHSSGGVHLIEIPDFDEGARVRGFEDPHDGPRGWEDERDLFDDDGNETHGQGVTWGRGWRAGTVLYTNGDSIDVEWDDGEIEPWDRTALVAESHKLKTAPRDFRAAWQGFPKDWDWQGSNEAVDRQIGNAVPPLLAQHFGRQITQHAERPSYRGIRAAIHKSKGQS